DDRYLFIACGNQRFFHRLCLLLDHPEWISDPRFDAAPWGMVNPTDRRALAEQIEAIIATRPRDAWLRLLTEADIPNAPVQERHEFIDDPQVDHLNMRVSVNDPDIGATVQMGTPVRLHGTPGPPVTAGVRVATGPLWPARAPSVVPRTPPDNTAGPLAGVRVVDLTSYIAGSYCPMTLADYGADVIKVESLDGDAFRTLGFGFLGWNRGKRSIALDLRTDEGRQIVYDLVRTADVVAENFRPGVAAKLGVDDDTLRAINPRLIYSTATAFGAGGPLGHLPGFDPLLQARSGAMAAQGGVDGGFPPVYYTVGFCDYVAALLSVAGICAALVHRARGGEGQRVETSLVQSAMAGQAGEFIFYPGRPDPPPGGPDLDGVHALPPIRRRTAGCFSPPQRPSRPPPWRAPRASRSRVGRTRSHNRCTARWRTRSPMRSQAPAGVWVERLLAAGAPAGRVLTARDLFDDPHLAANDLIVEHQHPLWGRVRQTGVLVRFAATPGRAQQVAPLLGEHTGDVLRALGRGDAEIDALCARGDRAPDPAGVMIHRNGVAGHGSTAPE
ncbi:MAG: CoA transferase, partial [Dehalococcoidia bacterium]